MAAGTRSLYVRVTEALCEIWSERDQVRRSVDEEKPSRLLDHAQKLLKNDMRTVLKKARTEVGATPQHSGRILLSKGKTLEKKVDMAWDKRVVPFYDTLPESCLHPSIEDVAGQWKDDPAFVERLTNVSFLKWFDGKTKTV
jgi:hypothetical protein